MMAEKLTAAARRCVEAAKQRKIILTAAESCTGGLVSAALTDIPGASAVFERGYVTYADAAKRDLLGVAGSLIDAHGAVSFQVAKAMAEGALAQSGADLAVAVTGIAGPDGGTPIKPVGLVFVATAGLGQGPAVDEYRFGDLGRSAIRESSAVQALRLLLRRMETQMR